MSDVKRITIVGAGAIGSSLAFLLAKAGHQVSVLARGERLAQLRRDRAIVTVEGDRALVEVVETLGSADLILVPVRPWQIDALLPMLKAGTAPVMFMFNAWNELPALREAVGRDRFSWGFPAIVAALRDGKLEVRVVPRALERVQITTLGAMSDFRPSWLDGWAQTFTAAGIPTVECSDMEAWLATHAAVMTPLMTAGVTSMTRGLSWAESVGVVDAWRSGFAQVRQRGLEVTPSTVAALASTPRWLLGAALWCASRVGALRPLGENGAEEPAFLRAAMARPSLPRDFRD